MSALPPKADICRVGCHVRFVPIADINGYSITSSASNCIELGTLKPSALAVFRLMTSSYLLICSMGRSAEDLPALLPLKSYRHMPLLWRRANVHRCRNTK